jgi:Domain of unknown function (DUF4340)
MSKKQVIILWILALILAGTAVFLKTRQTGTFQTNTERKRGQLLLPDFQPKEVARITFSSGSDKTTLMLKNGKWLVSERSDYPANVAIINQLLRTLAEVKVTQGIEADASFAPRFGMDPGSSDKTQRGVDVVFGNDAGSELLHLTFGKTIEQDGGSPFGVMGGMASGRYVKNTADSSGVYLTAEMFSFISAEPRSWLQEGFIKVQNPKMISVTQAGKADLAWKVSREDENANFSLEGKQDKETLEDATLTPLKNIFSMARFDDLVPEDQVAAQAIPERRQEVKIDTFDGFHYDITLTPAKIQPNDPAPDDGGAPEERYLFTMKVQAQLATERKKADKETEEQAKKADKEFADKKAALEKQLALEKTFEGHTYKVSRWTVDMLMKDRSTFIKKDQPSASPEGATTPPMILPPQGQ